MESISGDCAENIFSKEIRPFLPVSPHNSWISISPSSFTLNFIADYQSANTRTLLPTMYTVRGHCAVVKISAISGLQYIRIILAGKFLILSYAVVHLNFEVQLH